MSGLWVAGGSWLNYSPGDFAGDGAFTLAVLFNPTFQNTALIEAWHAGTLQQSMLLFNWSLFGTADFASGFGPYGPPSPGWVLLAITKPSGSLSYRFHSWVYASDGSGTMTHGLESPSDHHVDFATADQIRLGDWNAGAIGGAGSLAVAGFWDRALSDAELDTLVSTSLGSWAALAPDLGIHLGSWTGTTGDVVFSGSSGTGSLTGTVSSGANPPGFTFTFGGSSYALSGTVAVTSSTSGAVNARVGVSGVVTAVSGAAGTPAARYGLTGVVAAVSGTSGLLRRVGEAVAIQIVRIAEVASRVVKGTEQGRTITITEREDHHASAH